MRASSWNKGLTKQTNPSVQKISDTMKRRRLDNFAVWRKEQLKKRPKEYHKLARSGDLAELIGIVLGDGYIGQHDRTQVLRIVSNSNNPGFINRYSSMVEKVFRKKPGCRKRKTENGIDIVLYEKNIADRLGLATGAKTHRVFELPSWIQRVRLYKIRFLRGLYETDGCHCEHLPTYTHKFIFTNVNQSLLDIVFVLLCEFGFHPSKTKSNIQISRKLEVERALRLLKFREYSS